MNEFRAIGKILLSVLMSFLAGGYTFVSFPLILLYPLAIALLWWNPGSLSRIGGHMYIYCCLAAMVLGLTMAPTIHNSGHRLFDDIFNVPWYYVQLTIIVFCFVTLTICSYVYYKEAIK